jgi:hypothetical protein
MAQRVKESKKTEELGELVCGLTIYKTTHTYKYQGVRGSEKVLTYVAERKKDLCIPATIRLHAKTYNEVRAKATEFANYYEMYVEKMKPYRKDQILYRKKLAAFIKEYMSLGPIRVYNKYLSRCAK